MEVIVGVSFRVKYSIIIYRNVQKLQSDYRRMLPAVEEVMVTASLLLTLALAGDREEC